MSFHREQGENEISLVVDVGLLFLFCLLLTLGLIGCPLLCTKALASSVCVCVCVCVCVRKPWLPLCVCVCVGV